MLEIVLWICLLLFGALVVWVLTALRRAKQKKERYIHFMKSPLPVWSPPQKAPSEVVSIPSFEGIDWKSLSPQVDAEGVHFVDYDALGQRGVSGKKRNPADIATFGIKRAKRYLDTKDPSDLLLAARQFQYLVDTAAPIRFGDADGIVWCADFDVGYQYRVQAPWKSAYAQTFAMCAMLWAGWLTGDRSYLDLYRKGLVSLGRTLEEGGLAFKTAHDGLFFEEVAAPPAHHILNGHLYSLLNLFRMHETTGTDEEVGIFELGVQGTVDMLPKFDRYGYSLYSLAPNAGLRNHFNIANSFYHHSHVVLLRTLHELSGRRVFRQYADKWEARCDGFFDTAWTTVYLMFKDAMKVVKKF